MIIVCSGPDTYRALEKSRELVSAFRQKYDSKGLATEVIDGSEGLKVILSRLSSASLFGPKKMIRADGCLSAMKFIEVKILAEKLYADQDQTVLLTLEEEEPDKKILETLKSAPLFHYIFDIQPELAFKKWVREQALKLSVNEKIADRIAESCAGDSWSAINELQKNSVLQQDEAHSSKYNTENIFELASKLLEGQHNWRELLARHADEGLVLVVLSQLRGYIRARDGYTQVLHPYLVSKIRKLKISSPELKLLNFIRTSILERRGLLQGKENETLF